MEFTRKNIFTLFWTFKKDATLDDILWFCSVHYAEQLDDCCSTKEMALAFFMKTISFRTWKDAQNYIKDVYIETTSEENLEWNELLVQDLENFYKIKS